MAPQVIQINKKQKSNGLFYAAGALGAAFAVDYWLSNKKEEEELLLKSESSMRSNQMSQEKADKALKKLLAEEKAREEPPAPLDEKDVEEISRFSKVDDFSEEELREFMPSVEDHRTPFEMLDEESKEQTPESIPEVDLEPEQQVPQQEEPQQELESQSTPSVQAVEPKLSSEETPEPLDLKLAEDPVQGSLDESVEFEEDHDLDALEEEVESLEAKLRALEEGESTHYSEYLEYLPVVLWKLLLIVAIALAWQYGRSCHLPTVPQHSAKPEASDSSSTDSAQVVDLEPAKPERTVWKPTPRVEPETTGALALVSTTEGTETISKPGTEIVLPESARVPGPACADYTRQTNSLGELTFAYPKQEEGSWMFAFLVVTMMLI